MRERQDAPKTNVEYESRSNNLQARPPSNRTQGRVDCVWTPPVPIPIFWLRHSVEYGVALDETLSDTSIGTATFLT